LRAALTLAMLEDVIDATTLLPGWETWVVSPVRGDLQDGLIRRDHPRLPAGAPRRGVDHGFGPREGERGPVGPLAGRRAARLRLVERLHRENDGAHREPA